MSAASGRRRRRCPGRRPRRGREPAPGPAGWGALGARPRPRASQEGARATAPSPPSPLLGCALTRCRPCRADSKGARARRLELPRFPRCVEFVICFVCTSRAHFSGPSLHHSAITRRPPLMLQFFSRTKSGQLARPLLAPTDDDDDDDALAKELSPSASVRGGSADTGSARAPATAATAAGDAAAAAAAHGTAAVALPPRHHDAIVRSFAPGLFRALRKECVPVLFCSIPPQLSPNVLLDFTKSWSGPDAFFPPTLCVCTSSYESPRPTYTPALPPAATTCRCRQVRRQLC